MTSRLMRKENAKSYSAYRIQYIDGTRALGFTYRRAVINEAVLPASRPILDKKKCVHK